MTLQFVAFYLCIRFMLRIRNRRLVYLLSGA